MDPDDSLESQIEMIEREFAAESSWDGRAAVLHRHIEPAEKADDVLKGVRGGLSLYEAIMIGPGRHDLIEVKDS